MDGALILVAAPADAGLPRGASSHRMTVDVSELAVDGVARLDVQILIPAVVSAPTLLCVPGGGMDKRYFDLPVRGYSFTSAMLERGHAVALLDPPGVGESDRPEDLWSLTPSAVARAIAASADEVSRFLVQMAPAPVSTTLVGLGHSMGAALVIRTQAQFAPFAGLVLLGWSDVGLPELVDPSYRCAPSAPTDAWLLAAARASTAWQKLPRTHPVLNPDAETLPAVVQEALRGVRSRLLPVVAFASYAPGATDSLCRPVSVPVQVVVGEHDLARDGHLAARAFPSAAVQTRVLERCGHDQVTAATRGELHDVIHTWSHQLI